MKLESVCMDEKTATAVTATAPAPKPTPVSQPAPAPALVLVLPCAAAAAMSGLLLFACHQPLGWGSYLGWFALAPFLMLVRWQARPAFVYGAALFCGMCFYLPALSWMRVADRAMVLGWIGLSLYCALYFVVALWAIRCLERWRLPLVMTVPIVWSALEFFRSFFLTGFAWYYLAHTQHDTLPMIQITDLGGVYLVTFLIAAVNALIFDIAYQFPEVRQWFGQAELEPYRTYSSVEILNRGALGDCFFRRNVILEAGAVVLLLAGTYGYGMHRLGQEASRPGPTVCLLQSDLDQRLREDAAGRNGHSSETVQQHFTDLNIVAALNQHAKPDLIIWPETSFPVPWFEISSKFPIEKMSEKEFKPWRDNEIYVRDKLVELTAKATRTPHLVGMNCFYLSDEGKTKRFNIALHVGAQGKIENKYDKIHRVPFGEYVPLKDWLPFLSMLTPYEGDFGIQQGEKFTRFEAGRYHFGVLVCFEDTDPFLARRYLRDDDDGPPVDFLVNMSNDGWFDGSSEHEEHLAVSRFRAIECRRSMVRAVNMGVSAVIDANGRVLKMRELTQTTPPMWAVSQDGLGVQELAVGDWHRYKKRAGVVLAMVPIDSRSSFYASAGDWLPMGCWLFLVVSALGALYYRRRERGRAQAGIT